MPGFNVQELIDQLGPNGGDLHLPPSGPWLPFEDRGKPLRIKGLGAGMGSVHSTIGTFDPTDVDTSPNKAAVYLTAPGSVIEFCTLAGPSNANRARGRGLWMRGHFSSARFVNAHWFRDQAIYWNAGTSSGTNANSAGLFHCRVTRSGDGFIVDGEEANSGYIIGCYATGNDRYGFFESSFLGHPYFGCHSANNGAPAGGGAPQIGANFAQGGSPDSPKTGGDSNYSGYIGCYNEGWPCFFKSAQIDIVQAGGNLERYAFGWPGSDGRPTPFPGTASGARARQRFLSQFDLSDTLRDRIETDKPTRGAGGRYALESYRYIKEQQNAQGGWDSVFPSDSDKHYTFERWQDDTSPTPEWFGNLRLLDRLDGAGAAAWRCPLGWSDERHSSGAGNLAITGAIIGTPFDYALPAGVNVPAGQERELIWQHNYLRDSSAGYTGSLVLSGPHIQPRAPGQPWISHNGLERIGPTRVRTILKNNGQIDGFCAAVVAGRRHTIAIPKA